MSSNTQRTSFGSNGKGLAAFNIIAIGTTNRGILILIGGGDLRLLKETPNE
jgi:hypothetical protein